MFRRVLSLRRTIVFISLLILTASIVPACFGQLALTDGEGSHGHKSLNPTRTEETITLDGNLDEAVWGETPVSLGFLQRDPEEGQPSSERTEFRVLYTANTLYIGVISYESDAGAILARERRRDNSLENDDTISIVLDTFHDHRNSFLFRTNPLGTQYDALITDEGNTINENWDEQWSVGAQITQAGWVVEIGIPFKSLRVQDSADAQTWGFDVERVIRRKNEFSYWNNYRRGFTLQNTSQSGHLTGITEIESGLRFRVKPYLLAGFSRTSDRSRSTLCQDPKEIVTPSSDLCNASDIGIEVIKYRVSPSLTWDFTWKTDFAQTEVDDQQVNLDRFALFFPEKREFFQEGAGTYEFGTASGESPMAIFKAFHTRQIGLSSGQPVPIIGGTRLTGRVAGLTVGMMNVQTEPIHRIGIPASNYSVIRAKRDVLERSTIGIFMLNRETGTPDFNRIFGVDANFVFYRYLNINAVANKSSSLNNNGDDWATSGGVIWQSDFLHTGVKWLTVDRSYRNDMGFVPRKNQRRFMPTFALQPRPDSDLFRQFIFRFHSDYTNNQDNVLETRLNHYTIETRFESGDVVALAPHTRFERLSEPFEIRPGIIIPVGDYRWWFNVLRFNTDPGRRFSAGGNFQNNTNFFGGKLNGFIFTPSFRVTNNLSLEVDYTINHARFNAGSYRDVEGNSPEEDITFTDHVINSRVNYNFSNRLLTSTSIQFNNSGDDFVGFNFRLNYIFRPGDDLFFIYNEGRRIDGLLDGQRDRTIQAKLTYSFDY